jgi:putative hydrolase of the HAD superfamily
MPSVLTANAAWDRIDTVLLDLDGTLLDLEFDNHFWQTRVPEAWGVRRGLDLQQARAVLAPRFSACEGTLDWYCEEYWSRELGLDITELTRGEAERIRWLPGAREFLLRIRALGKRLVLLTNSPPQALAIKDERTQVLALFDASFSSHAFGAPKEDQRFWSKLQDVEPHEPARCLFVDDNLAVLRAARTAGIGQVIGIHRPQARTPVGHSGEFPAVEQIEALLESA